MKNVWLASLILSLQLFAEGSPQPPVASQIVEGRDIVSTILEDTIRYSVYLPPGYDTSEENYPVIYLLHGAGGDETSWVRDGGIRNAADTLIAQETIPPMVLVMPAGGRTRYLNNHDDTVRYEDFFFNEFMPHIESAYRIRTGPESTAVVGSSMGGYGSLMYALRHPDRFAAAVSFSGSFCEDDRVRAMSDQEWNESTRGAAYGLNLTGEDRFTPHYRAWDPCHVVANTDPDAFDTVRLYLDCGDDDFRNDGNAALHVLMRKLGIAHEYRVRDGGHGWEYYRSGLAEGLTFVATSFATWEGP